MISRDVHAGRVALVHDWLNQMGGAENVLEELVGLFPAAPLYTSIYAPERMPAAYRSWKIHTSFMQRLPGVTTHHQRYLPLYPLAFSRFRLNNFDLVLSNKSGFCHGVGIGTNTGANGDEAGKGARPLHVCYCLTPTRFLWLYEQYRQREQIGVATNALLQPLLALLRRWDYAAAQRVDHFIAISRTVQERIRRIYKRESVVIHPPVDTSYFTPDAGPNDGKVPKDGIAATKVGDYYLIVSRLIPYKRIDLAVEAFRQLPSEKLVIVGEGRDLNELKAGAASNITFLGHQERATIRDLLRGCKAFLFPGLEDFGIAPVEAMSVGRPVIAYGAGGALDTVAPGVTGEHFAEQTPQSLAALIAGFDPGTYDPAACQAQAARFSSTAFRTKLTEHLSQLLAANSSDKRAPALDPVMN